MRSEKLIQAFARTAQLNRLRLQQLDIILTEFESADIKVLPMKGADLLGRAYGGVLGLRPMVDVDLLYHGEDLPEIERILQANGFRPRGASSNPTYVSTTGALSLDLFPEIWYRDDIDAVWKRSVPRQLAGRIRPAMHPEDALIYLVAYQTIHRGRLAPQMAVDVAALLEAEERFIDWNHLVHEADICRLRFPLYHGLSYARDKGGAKIPTWVLDALRPPASQRRINRLYQRLVTERGIPELGYFLLVFSRPGYKNKLRALWRIFFPPQDFLTLRYGKKSRWGGFWIHLTRPAHLAYRGGLLLVRMGCRLLLPFNRVSLPGLHLVGQPASSGSSRSVQRKTSLYPGTTERPTPTEQTQGHQHKAEQA